jgi:gamma-butyrobetaine dioxygenase
MIVDEIFALFAAHGSGLYGEDVSLERHMLQSAAMARALDAGDVLVAAALLHDVGHFLHPEGAEAALAGRDIAHEALGAAWLSRGFGPEVTAPVALHVAAKRYLCAVEPDYYATLSDASKLSLAAQGGAMDDGEAAAFEKRPGYAAAVLLRRCDDRGKDIGTETAPLEGYRALLTALARA